MGFVQKRTYTDGRKPRYIGRVKVGGKEQQKAFSLKRDAEDWVRTREGAKPTGARVDNKLMTAALTNWAEQADGSTKVQRSNLVDNLGDLAVMRVGDVDTDAVRKWRRTLADGRPWADGKPLAPTTISTLTRHLSAFFNDAVARDQIPRNPVQRARSGAGVIEKTSDVVDPSRLITVDEVRAVLRAAEGPVDTILELMATSGLRPNEVNGLRVSSIDFDAGSVHVTEQAAGVYGEWDWKALKTAKARRSVPLPTSTLTALRRHVDAKPEELPGSPLFRTQRGYQWSTPHLYRAWKDAAKTAGVVGHSPKSLRHFYASKLIRAGESVAVVQSRLGHSSPMVTLSVYTHLWEDAADTTRAAVEGLFAD